MGHRDEAMNHMEQALKLATMTGVLGSFSAHWQSVDRHSEIPDGGKSAGRTGKQRQPVDSIGSTKAGFQPGHSNYTGYGDHSGHY